MAEWLLLRSMPHLRLLVRVLMVVLTIGGVAGHGGTADDSGMAMAADRPTVPGAATTARTAHHFEAGRSASESVLAPSGHQCPHCPPAECATAMPCASGPSTQSAPSAGPSVPGLAAHWLREFAAACAGTSIPHAPRTPPPQAA
jgi:hypothetical protein